MKRLDLFCNVVDNFGDAGVCWRLARQMAHDELFHVRLFIDKIEILSKICKAINPNVSYQNCEGVTVCLWPEPATLFSESQMPDVVIEGFGVHLPEHYIQAMLACVKPPFWINLEYLTAEDWIESVHQMASPQSQTKLTKYFFFPGFTQNTGGLIRESSLLEQRYLFQTDSHKVQSFLKSINVHLSAGVRLVSLFCYPDAPVDLLFEQIEKQTQPVMFLIPEGVAVDTMKKWFGYIPKADDQCEKGTLTLHILPMLDQIDYDRLLWACDFNFVRGEDSFIRAQWAAKPFLWHIYPQQEQAHLDKLAAFVDIYLKDMVQQTHDIRQCFFNWNTHVCSSELVSYVLNQTPKFAQNWCEQLAQQKDLAHALSDFIENKSENNV